MGGPPFVSRGAITRCVQPLRTGSGLRSKPAVPSRPRGPLPRTGTDVRTVAPVCAVDVFSCGAARATPRNGRSPLRSSAQTETLDDRAVAVDVLGAHVVEEPA